MRKLKLFSSNIEHMVLRFYMMIAIVIILTAFHQFILAALLGNVIAVSFILGVDWKLHEEELTRASLHHRPMGQESRRAA